MTFERNKVLDLDDNALTRALILRDEYLPEARNLIIEESIKRGIIRSENDLDQERFAPISIKNQRFFQFSMITSVGDARQITNSIFRYFYFISLGYGGMAAIYRIFGRSIHLWANLMLMIISMILAILFHRYKSFAISLAFVFLTAISICYCLAALILLREIAAIPGIFLSLMLFYFSSEAFFATRFIKFNKNQSRL